MAGEGTLLCPAHPFIFGYVLSLGNSQHILRTGRAQSITHKNKDLHSPSSFSRLTHSTASQTAGL